MAGPAVAAPSGTHPRVDGLCKDRHTTGVELSASTPVALRFAAAFDESAAEVETALRRVDDNLPRPNIERLRADFYSKCSRFQRKAQASGAPATTSGPCAQLRSAESEAEALFGLLNEIDAYKQDLNAATASPTAPTELDAWEELAEARAEIQRRKAIAHELNAPYLLD